MRIFDTLLLEFISNIPIWVGFIIAAKLLLESRQNWWRSILILFVSSLLSAVIIGLVEPIKLGGDTLAPLHPIEVLSAALVFTVVALPFLWYVPATANWITWKSDMALALMCGIVVTLGEALAMHVYDIGILALHTVSMAAATWLNVTLMRGLAHRSWRFAIVGVVIIALIASVLIVAIEYVPRGVGATTINPEAASLPVEQ